ncbi:hypothetical protein O9G_004892 [Rozella allomycis CSF55]|uniref:Uncharacterized protein n=1 Tax=Rozella allomycis (strain CSF55) TaxID=988480 RepID=A0A075ARN9_ROZAC|nr:hypothetical protein O9G_004892 [Rozella allomycis CSF55]|eukprot:EPZ32845.1 hypothetical protein O9G_004892 [Rozella allomycis CSF55]
MLGIARRIGTSIIKISHAPYQKITNINTNPFQFVQIRSKVFFENYEPNYRKRKRKVGFLARLKTKAGKKILFRRWMKGRKHLGA